MSQYRRLPAPSFRDKEIPPKDWMPNLAHPRFLSASSPEQVRPQKWNILRCERELFIAGYMPDGYPMKQYQVNFVPMPAVAFAHSAEKALELAYQQFPFFAGRLAVEPRE